MVLAWFQRRRQEVLILKLPVQSKRVNLWARILSYLFWLGLHGVCLVFNYFTIARWQCHWDMKVSQLYSVRKWGCTVDLRSMLAPLCFPGASKMPRNIIIMLMVDDPVPLLCKQWVNTSETAHLTHNIRNQSPCLNTTHIHIAMALVSTCYGIS